MRSFKWKKVVVLIAVLVTSIGLAPMAFSEEGVAEEKISNRPIYKEKTAELRKLKEKNPAEFERVVKERKEKLKERLQKLKENDPKKYEEVKEKMIHRRKEKLQRLREENPEKFREIMENKVDRRDHREDHVDHRENRFDRREDHRDQGVRDHGQGVGRGKGQGGVQRSSAKGPGSASRKRY